MKGLFPMTFAKRLSTLIPLICPQFYTVTDTFGHELVLLRRSGKEASDRKESFCVLDRTAFEAEHNAMQVFDRLSEKDLACALLTGKTLAENLLNELKKTYPSKRFTVTVEIRPMTRTCIRFHQIWPGEEPDLSPDDRRKNTEVLVLQA